MAYGYKVVLVNTYHGDRPILESASGAAFPTTYRLHWWSTPAPGAGPLAVFTDFMDATVFLQRDLRGWPLPDREFRIYAVEYEPCTDPQATLHWPGEAQTRVMALPAGTALANRVRLLERLT